MFPILNDRKAVQRRPDERRLAEPVKILAGTPTLERYRSSVLIQYRDFTIDVATHEIAAGDEGVLVAHGDPHGGYVLYVEDGRIMFAVNSYGRVAHTSAPLGEGVVGVQVRAEATESVRWNFTVALTDGAGVTTDVATLDDQFQLVGMAPWTGISVGVDAADRWCGICGNGEGPSGSPADCGRSPTPPDGAGTRTGHPGGRGAGRGNGRLTGRPGAGCGARPTVGFRSVVAVALVVGIPLALGILLAVGVPAPVSEAFLDVRRDVADTIADGVDGGAQSAADLAEHADQRVVGGVEILLVRFRGLAELFADLGVVVLVPAWVLSSQDCRVGAAVHPFLQLGGPQHRERVGEQFDVEELEDAVAEVTAGVVLRGLGQEASVSISLTREPPASFSCTRRAVWTS